MTPSPTASLCIICHDRPAELERAVQSAAGFHFDQLLLLDMASDPPIEPPSGCRLFRLVENVGVAAGRNLLARESTADILVFLDDDAVFSPGTDLDEAIKRFASNPRLGAVAFRVVRPGGVTDSSEYPFRGRPRDTTSGRPCGYFVGAGHAVRRSAWMEAGGLDERFFYSTEEIDLSMTLTRLGYEIWYDPVVVVEHRPSTRGRSAAPRLSALRLRNRMVYARRHLPWPVLIPHVFLWGIRTLTESVRAGTVDKWVTAWRDGITLRVERAPLPFVDLWRVHRRGGRVLW